MALNARPNLNGNTPQHFRDAYRKLRDALDQVEDAINTIGSDVTHGRNYQTVTDGEAQRRDIAKLRNARASLQELNEFKTELGEAIIIHEKGPVTP